MGTDTLEQFTCIGCEETVTEGDRYYEDSRWSDVQDDLLCYGCFESDTEHASTLVTVHQDGFNRVLLGDHVIIDLGYGDQITCGRCYLMAGAGLPGLVLMAGAGTVTPLASSRILLS